jgi:hypothetical protein
MTSYLLCNLIVLTYVRKNPLKYLPSALDISLSDIFIRVWIVLIVGEWLHFFSVTAVVIIKAPAQYSESAHLRS